MAKKPKPIPDGYSAITPYLRVKGAREAIAFYGKAFGAKSDTVMDMGGMVGHAEITINGAKICLSDEFPDRGVLGPKSLGGTSFTLMHYASDVDAVVARAKKAGGIVRQEPADQFWGARMGIVEDPFGHVWLIQPHIEDVSEAEMQRRLSAMMAQHAGAPAKKKAAAKKK